MTTEHPRDGAKSNGGNGTTAKPDAHPDWDEHYEVVLREPGTILLDRLRKDRAGVGEPSIREFACSPLVKSGDNYGSTILRVRAVVAVAGIENGGGDDGKSEEEVLELVAKMLPASEMSRRIFDVQFTFKKEVFVYEDLIPTYRGLWGQGDEFEVAPKFYGARLSLEPDAQGDEVDGDAVIMMENLKASGYYMGDRHRGLDKAHLRIALRILAKFHAVGLAVKLKLPNYLDKLRLYAKPMPMQTAIVKPFIETTIEELGRDPRLGPYVERVRRTGHLEDLEGTFRGVLEPAERWACVVHDDFWINNIMFRANRGDGGDGDNNAEAAQPCDARIVDFQTYCMSSPLKDLVFFLCTSMRAEGDGAAMTRDFDEMLEYYRRETREFLIERLGCQDMADDLFAEASFQERLRIDARRELFHLVMMTKVVELREGESLIESPANEHYLERFAKIVDIYAGKNWI